MRNFSFYCFFILVCLSFSASAEYILLEETYEIEALDVAVAKDGTGYVAGRECKTCPLRRFKIHPAILFTIQLEPKPLYELNRLRGKPAAFFIDIKSRKLLRVMGY